MNLQLVSKEGENFSHILIQPTKDEYLKFSKFFPGGLLPEIKTRIKNSSGALKILFPPFAQVIVNTKTDPIDYTTEVVNVECTKIKIARRDAEKLFSNIKKILENIKDEYEKTNLKEELMIVDINLLGEDLA